MIRANPALGKLYIAQRPPFADDIFAAIAERKDTLTDMTMWVGQCQWYEIHSQPDFSHAQLRKLLESCPSLRKLTFGADGECRSHGDGLVGMEGKCPHLEELRLHNMGFSGNSFATFLLFCPNLRVCHANESCIEDQDLERWHRQGWPKLHDFSPNWNVEQLETVVACAALFEEVRTYHVHNSRADMGTAAALPHMPHLHTVCLYSSLSVLKYLPPHCAHLRVLKIVDERTCGYCGSIGEILIAALPSLPQLEVLQWRLSSGLGETELMALAQHCPNLRSLDCERWEVTDAGLIALVCGCPTLRSLQFWYCYEGSVTDAFLQAIAQHCPYLEELRLPAMGWRPARSAVTEVLTACTLLRELCIPCLLRDGGTADSLVVPAGRLRRLTITVK